MTTENIDIKIREDGSREVKRNLKDIGDTARKSADGIDYLKKFLAALGSYLAVQKVVQYADAWASAAGMIKVATKTTAEAVAVMDGLFTAAQNTRQPLTELVQLYSRAARAGKELGASQQQLIDFSENIGKALAVQGTSAEQAKGALLQLGQAIGGSIVRAEEFNSILEGAPYILQVVANNLQEAGGSITKLRNIMIDGRLKSKDFFAAFEKGGKDIQKDFEKAPLTIAQGFTTIENALMKYIGQLDASLGVSRKFGEVAKFIADNFEQCVTILLSFGAAAAVAFAPGLIASFAASVKGLFALIAAHPFGALAAALAGAAVYLYKFRDALLIGVDDVTTLGDLLRALGEIAVSVFEVMKTAATDAFSYIGDLAKSAYAVVTNSTDDSVKEWAGSFTSFYDDVGSGFTGIVRGIAKTLDAIGGLITGLVIGAARILEGIPEAVANPFKRAYNFAAEQIEKIVNTLIEGVNKVRSILGADLIDTIKIPRAEVDTDYYTKYGQKIGESINDGFEAQGNFLLKQVDSVFSRAQDLAKERKIIEGFGKDKVNLNAKIGGGAANALDPKEVEKAAKALHSLLAGLNPIIAAEYELKQAHKVLDDARKNGLITQQKEIEYLSLLYEKYQDILDPLGAWNREMDVQLRLAGMSARSREVENQFIQIRNDLLSKGWKLDKEQEDQIRSRLITMQLLNEQMQAQDQLLSNSVETRRAFTTQLVAIQSLLNDPNSGFTQGDAAQAKNSLLTSAGIDTSNTALALEANLDQFRNMYAMIAEMRANNLIGEQDAAALTAKVWAQEQSARFKSASDFFGNLAELQNSKSKEMARIGKAAAIAQATIKTYESATSAYASLAGIPYVGPALGAAAAAAAIAAGVANIQAIRSAPGFKDGGFTGMGNLNSVQGVVHGQEFVMDAENTARNRPALEAMHAGVDFRDMVGGNGPSIKIENYGTSKDFDVEQISRDEIRIIARDEARRVAPEAVATELANPNSRVSTSMKNNVQGGARRR